MQLRKKINLRKYLIFASSSTLILFILTDQSLLMLLFLLGFCGVTLSNQLMLMMALQELLKTSHHTRRMDRWDKMPKDRAYKELGKFIRKNPAKMTRIIPSAKRRRDFQSILRSRWKRIVKNRQEQRYNKNMIVKRKSLKIVSLVIGKLLILVLAIAFSVHFIQDRIIFPVINHVIQIIALALSVKKG